MSSSTSNGKTSSNRKNSTSTSNNMSSSTSTRKNLPSTSNIKNSTSISNINETSIPPLPQNNNTLQTLTKQKLALLEKNRSRKYKVFVTCNGKIIWNLEDMRNRMFAPTLKDAAQFREFLLNKYLKFHIPNNFYRIYLYENDSIRKMETVMDYRLFGLEKMMLNITDFSSNNNNNNNNNYGHFIDLNNNSLHYLRNKKKNFNNISSNQESYIDKILYMKKFYKYKVFPVDSEGNIVFNIDDIEHIMFTDKKNDIEKFKDEYIQKYGGKYDIYLYETFDIYMTNPVPDWFSEKKRIYSSITTTPSRSGNYLKENFIDKEYIPGKIKLKYSPPIMDPDKKFFSSNYSNPKTNQLESSITSSNIKRSLTTTGSHVEKKDDKSKNQRRTQTPKTQTPKTQTPVSSKTKTQKQITSELLKSF